jgi:hypothetical protein
MLYRLLRKLGVNNNTLSMSDNIMPAERALELYFAGLTETQEFTYFSGFTAALRDARKFTKRSQETGEKIQDDAAGDLGSWLGTLGYLALLDQVGKCFKPANVNNVGGNAIVKALRYFLNLNDNEINEIYALRCAFAHDYSLFNINQGNPDLTHYFVVTQGDQPPLVTLPQVQWDGDHNNRTALNVTIINLEKLGDLIEGICEELRQRSNGQTLEITLADGSDELIHRYSFYTRRR